MNIAAEDWKELYLEAEGERRRLERANSAYCREAGSLQGTINVLRNGHTADVERITSLEELLGKYKGSDTGDDLMSEAGKAAGDYLIRRLTDGEEEPESMPDGATQLTSVEQNALPQWAHGIWKRAYPPIMTAPGSGPLARPIGNGPKEPTPRELISMLKEIARLHSVSPVPESEDIPEDPTHAIKHLLEVIPQEELDVIKAADGNDLIQFHSTIGRWIRNRYHLWEESRLGTWFKDRGVEHPDSMSSILLKGVWFALGGMEIDLESNMDVYRISEEKPKAPEGYKPGVEYPHKYPGTEGKQFFTSDCSHGCKCWMGSTRSGGPEGVDPFGECPSHPDRPESADDTEEKVNP